MSGSQVVPDVPHATGNARSACELESHITPSCTAGVWATWPAGSGATPEGRAVCFPFARDGKRAEPAGSGDDIRDIIDDDRGCLITSAGGGTPRRHARRASAAAGCVEDVDAAADVDEDALARDNGAGRGTDLCPTDPSDLARRGVDRMKLAGVGRRIEDAVGDDGSRGAGAGDPHSPNRSQASDVRRVDDWRGGRDVPPGERQREQDCDDDHGGGRNGRGAIPDALPDEPPPVAFQDSFERARPCLCT
jgi:hypothetical protein